MIILQGIVPSLGKRDLEQLQQILKLEAEEQTHLLTSKLNSPKENYRTSPLNL